MIPALMIVALLFPVSILATTGATASCSAGTTCTVGEYLYNDVYALQTGATCTVTTNAPNGTVLYNGVAATEAATGWYTYAFTAPSTVGYYRTQFCCTSGTDYMCLDKSFDVITAPTTGSIPSSTDIAKEVWKYSDRTMSGFGNLISDIWGHVSSTGTTQSTTTVINNTQTVVTETRNLLEQIVNKPVIQNVIEEDTTDLQSKSKETKIVADNIYMNTQFAVSRLGVLLLKKENNFEDITNILGEITDDMDTQTLIGRVAWMQKNWNWDLASKLKIVLVDARKSLDKMDGKSALISLKLAEKIIGESTDSAKIGNTLFSNYKSIGDIAAKLDLQREQTDKLLISLDEKGIDEASQAILAINQIPKASLALKSAFPQDNYIKRLRNKVLAIRGLIDSNKMFLARTATTPMANSWLEEGSMVFKTLVTNPSSNISQSVEVKYYLPEEVKKEDILGTDGEIEVKYDAEKNKYYVEGKILLTPNESQTIAVRVTDLWSLSDSLITSLRNQAAELAKPLEKTSYFAQGVTLKSDIDVAIDKAVSLEKSAITPEQKIRAHREAELEIARAKTEIDQLKNLVTQVSSSNSLVGFVGGSQAIAVWGMIVIMIAGFVFLAIYMKTITSHLPAVTPTETKKNHGNSVVAIVLAASLSSGLTGLGTWKLLSSTPVQAPMAVLSHVTTVPATGGPDIVRTNSKVNLRVSPDYNSKIIKKLDAMTEVIRLEQKDGWIKIDPEGWIASVFIDQP